MSGTAAMRVVVGCVLGSLALLTGACQATSDTPGAAGAEAQGGAGAQGFAGAQAHAPDADMGSMRSGPAGSSGDPDAAVDEPVAPRVCEGGLLRSQAELDALAGCVEITADLTIAFDADLEPLSQLKTVGGWLTLGDYMLGGVRGTASLHGLRSLQHAYGLAVSNITAPSLEGLEHLQTLGGPNAWDGGLAIGGAENLVDLTGLSGLERTTLLMVGNMPGLETMNGLDTLADAAIIHLLDLPALRSTGGLRALRTLGGFQIQRCDALQAIEAESLVSLAALSVTSNAALSAFPALSTLTSVPEIEIARNPSLTRLSLPALESAEDHLRVSKNAKLSSLDLPKLARVGELTFVRNEALPTTAVTDLEARIEVTQFSKVGGNLGDESPPRDPCPWTTDSVCDEEQDTNLCAAGTDPFCDVVGL